MHVLRWIRFLEVIDFSWNVCMFRVIWSRRVGESESNDTVQKKMKKKMKMENNFSIDDVISETVMFYRLAHSDYWKCKWK